MKKILLPTDFSQNADDALKYSLQLIGRSPAEIKLFHVLDPADYIVAAPEGTAVAINRQIDEAKRSLANLYKKAIKYLQEFGNNNTVIKSEFSMGDVVKNIKNESSEFEYDVIIMGTRGKNYPFMDKLLGTVASQVIRGSIPVILVPSGYRFKEIDNIIFPTKMDHKDPYELNKAMNILQPHNAVIQCLHLVKNEEEKNNKNVEEFANYTIEHSPAIQTTFFIEVSDNVSSTIDEYARSYDAELIVMPKKEKSTFERLTSKNHIKEMLWITERPLMIVN